MIERTETLVPGPAEGLAGLLGTDVPEELPLLWHWVYLLERPAAAVLGVDGHPTEGIPAPPGEGMRRMFGGGQVDVRRPLRLGREATRRTEILDRQDKQGRSGPLTLVTVQHTFVQDERIAIVDRQDIVYLPGRPGGSPAPPPRPEPPEPGAEVQRIEPPTTRTLFQFSALTYNAHRIHYDRDFTREVEGYPDLLVHGPLQALYLAEAARRHAAAAGRPAPTVCGYRLLAPLFLGVEPHLVLTTPPDSVRAQVRTEDRVTATAEFAWQAGGGGAGGR